MILEILIVLEILAFLFLALGLFPAKPITEGGNIPLANKIIFIIVSSIIFFSLGMTSTSFEYTHCYVNQSIMDYGANATTNTATCAAYGIESLGLANINYGMGIISILLGLIILLIGATSRNDYLYKEE